MIRDIFANRGFVWEEIVQKSSVHLQTIKEHQGKFDDELIVTGNLTTAVLKKMAEDLQTHVANGGNLGNFLIKRKVIRQYKDQLQQVKCNGLEILIQLNKLQCSMCIHSNKICTRTTAAITNPIIFITSKSYV